MIGVGIVGFALSWMLFGDSFIGWLCVAIFGGIFIAGVFKETKAPW